MGAIGNIFNSMKHILSQFETSSNYSEALQLCSFGVPYSLLHAHTWGNFNYSQWYAGTSLNTKNPNYWNSILAILKDKRTNNTAMGVNRYCT